MTKGYTAPPGHVVSGTIPRAWAGARRVTGLFTIGGVAWLVAGRAVAVVAVAVAVVSPVVARRRRRSRDRRQIDTDIAIVFEVAARSVRAGAAVPEALQQAARTADGAGGRVVTALLAAPPRSAEPGREAGRSRPVGGFVGAPVTESRTGAIVAAVMAMVYGAAGGGARGLEAGAVLLREHERARVEIEAGAAHARASAALLIAVPVIFGGAALVLFPSSPGGMLSHPAALVSVVAGVAMEAAGAGWTARLVRAVHGGAT